MKTRPVALAVLLAFAPPAFHVAPAFAQASADDPDTKAARARFQEGVSFYDKGDFENARASFKQAYSLRKHPAVLLNLAQSCLRSGHHLEAAKYFQTYLRDAPNISPAQRADAERGLSDARQKTGRIEISAPTGTVLTVDGEGVGTAPLSDVIDVEPGAHKVKAGNEEQSISVNPGQKVAAKFGSNAAPVAAAPLPPPPSSPPPSPPPAEPTPPPPASTAPPPDAEKPAEHKTNLFAPPATMVPVYVGGVVALIGVGLAIGVGVIAKNNAQNNANSVAQQIRTAAAQQGRSASSICGPPPATNFATACAAFTDNNKTVDTDALVGNIGVGIAVAGAAFAVGWYLFAPKKAAEEPKAATWKSPTVAPLGGPNTAGLSLSGAF